MSPLHILTLFALVSCMVVLVRHLSDVCKLWTGFKISVLKFSRGDMNIATEPLRSSLETVSPKNMIT